MTDENGAVVDGNWKCNFVFDRDWAWHANWTIADDDCGERNEGATGRDLERMLAGFFRRDGGVSRDRSSCQQAGEGREHCVDMRGDDDCERRAASALRGAILWRLHIRGRGTVFSGGWLDANETGGVRLAQLTAAPANLSVAVVVALGEN